MPSAYQITGTAPLASFPISMGDFRELTQRLRPQDKASLELLFFYSYQHGVPILIDDLATIAGVGQRRWIAMAPQLAPFFVITDEAWNHPGLQEAHGAFFKAQEDDRLYRDRAKAFGAEGAARRKLSQAAKTERTRREAEHEVRDQVRNAEARDLPAGFAEGLISAKGEPRVSSGTPSPTLIQPYPTLTSFR